MAGAASATRNLKGESFRRRLLRQGLLMTCSALLGGTFVAESMRRRAQSDSLAINLMALPASHREILSSFENLDDSQLSNNTYVSAAESLLPHVRKLQPNISTHHLIRIQAASFLKKYHAALQQVLNDKHEDPEKELDVEEYALHLRRRLSDMNLAFDFIDFKNSEVSTNIQSLVKFNKMDYARLSRNANKLRNAFDDIYSANKVHSESDKNESESESESKSEAGDSPNSDAQEVETLKGKLLQKYAPESREHLLEHELMALYTHAPYLGEWGTFMKIGDALVENYGKLEGVHSDNLTVHEDGVNFADLYSIGKETDLVHDIPVPAPSNLKFNVKPIEWIKIKYNKYTPLGDAESPSQTAPSSSSSSSWFGASNEWRELSNDNFNDHVSPMNICRMGGVQKSLSVSKCVPRVQGPIFYDHRMKMRGSVTFMMPKPHNEAVDSNGVRIIPDSVELTGMNEFVPVRQIEEWDLKPSEVGKINELSGKIKIRREPVHEQDQCHAFELEYDCILKLGSNDEGYF
mmetsp:Transcript_11299/g.17153  ORF Transcript_11299/g.17153 Transcript_11299/m.17153 type:complete len:520 (-) Transcript_11299:73-1632(-)